MTGRSGGALARPKTRAVIRNWPPAHLRRRVGRLCIRAGLSVARLAMTTDPPKSTSEEEDEPVSIIHPPNRLAAKVAKRDGTITDLLANAETMLATMKDEFGTLVDKAVAELRVIYKDQWADLATRPQAVRLFHETANQFKGQSGSFNFPLLGEVADLFLDYLNDTDAADQQQAVILNYIETITIVWGQRIPGDGGPLGRQIVADLTKLNGKSAQKK